MLQCSIVLVGNNSDWMQVSTALLLHAQAGQLLPVLRLFGAFSALCAVLLTFRPLLTGLLRAGWLLLFPRLSLEQRQGRRQMRDRRLLARMMASSTGPSMAAELQAMAARQ